MHKSQLAGFIIDCKTDNIEEAADFWSAALGMRAGPDPGADDSKYRQRSGLNWHLSP